MHKIKKILEEYNQQFHIATLRDETIELLFSIIEKNNVTSILEIGSGVGYSAFRIASRFNHIKIDSIEKSEEKYNVAKKTLIDFRNINFINEDCFLFFSSNKYDLIIIDGPKRYQIELFNHLQRFANQNTIYFIDNIKLLALRDVKQKTNNQQKIIDSVDEFRDYLINHEQIKFKYYDIDDGVIVGSEKWN